MERDANNLGSFSKSRNSTKMDAATSRHGAPANRDQQGRRESDCSTHSHSQCNRVRLRVDAWSVLVVFIVSKNAEFTNAFASDYCSKEHGERLALEESFEKWEV